MTARRPRPPVAALTMLGEEGDGDSNSPPAPVFPIVAIGASAGGLEACQKLFDGLGDGAGAAFIVIQHLDPHHESLMVDLLAKHTTMTVIQAADGMRIEPRRVYVIGPGTYLSVDAGVLKVTRPEGVRGARRPFDFLLNGLALALGARTICVVLSGSLDDGSLGLKAVKAAGGGVIAQNPEEAGFDGMPRGAILTGEVDFILPIEAIPRAIARLARSMGQARRRDPGPELQAEPVLAIVDLVRNRTGHDFTLYKPGTLQRRISRRMALAAIPAAGMDRYLAVLRADEVEVDALARDLLIHVTGFFRDPKVFELLAQAIAPDMTQGRGAEDPIRIWAPGCSTGEEAYSIAMVFKEAIAASGRDVRLQVFASDIDPETVAAAREGLYPKSIEDAVSPARLARFFTREEQSFRVSPDLRACVVFTVQNILADPPFSRLDLISCRNLLIYLRAEAQAKVVATFHFALKPDGVLLLGSSENVGRADGRFEVISKPARLYRQVGRGRLGELNFPLGGAVRRAAVRPSPVLAATGQGGLAELCRRLVLETHAPAAILINRARECLYSLGPTDRYLRVAVGSPSLDLLTMARHGIRAKLAAAITRAFDQNATVLVHSGPLTWDKKVHVFDIEARTVQAGGETLVLVCFLDTAKARVRPGAARTPEDGPRAGDLETELETVKGELRSAIRNLEIVVEDQTIVNEEALSVNEEYQSTNEELITSKEELQSLNEELNALNAQLQETLERQRTTANDLQNVLYSSNVATLFLDRDLRIRFFTPATRSLFSVIPGDVGRPLSDLNASAIDADLFSDATLMLTNREPIAREVQTLNGSWYARRIMPYRTSSDAVEGVVITYVDITERMVTARKLEEVSLAAESANKAKSRFLAAASHDLRQPLQTLTLIQGLLARKVTGEAERKLIVLQEQCLAAMSGMLNTLLDINQIDAGITLPALVNFPINDLFDRLRDEFTYHARTKGLTLRMAACGLSIVSDPALLEQMIRNLVANAVKYTPRGKILVGCRRRGKRLSIQVLDSGIGMRTEELASIFEEYHQIDNVARERNRGLGLGLSIVKRLGDMLGHDIAVRSRSGKGSMFTIDVDRVLAAGGSRDHDMGTDAAAVGANPVMHTGAILVVEDDPDIRLLLQLVLTEEGHHVVAAEDAAQALDLVTYEETRPAIVVVDYNLPGGVNGLELAAKLRGSLGLQAPVVVLTGDISTETLRDIAQENCIPLHKPVKPEILNRVIQNLLPAGRSATIAPPAQSGPDIIAGKIVTPRA